MPFYIKTIFRRPASCIISAVCMATITFLLCNFSSGNAKLEGQIDETYSGIKVKCAITNLTGTNDDNLEIANWAVNLFLEDPRYSNTFADISFLDYVSNVCIKSNCLAIVNGTTITVSGLNNISIARELRPEEDIFISWNKGYDSSIFYGNEQVCVIPESMFEGQELKVTFFNKFDDSKSDTLSFVVAGTYHGYKDIVYCPWGIVAEEEMKLDEVIHADSLYADIIDNHRIDEFWEKCASKYFAKVDPEGVPQEWEGAIYKYYIYALSIYDDVLKTTIRSLETNRNIFAVCGMLTVAVSIGVGFVIGSIISKKNEKIFALKLVMGSEKRTIWAEVICELALFSLIGIAAAIAVSYAVTGYSPPWITVAASFAAEIAGITVVVVSVLNRDVLSLSGRKE